MTETHPLGEHRIEDQTARSRHQPRRRTLAPWALSERRGELAQVTRLAPEALRPKIIGDTLARQCRQAVLKDFFRARDRSQHDPKAIALECTARQFASMQRSRSYHKAFTLEAFPTPGAAPTRWYTEPLTGECMTVFEPGKAHILHPHPRLGGDFFGHPDGIGIALFHLQQHVTAGTRGFKTQALIHPKIFGLLA